MALKFPYVEITWAKSQCGGRAHEITIYVHQCISKELFDACLKVGGMKPERHRDYADFYAFDAPDPQGIVTTLVQAKIPFEVEVRVKFGNQSDAPAN